MQQGGARGSWHWRSLPHKPPLRHNRADQLECFAVDRCVDGTPLSGAKVVFKSVAIPAKRRSLLQDATAKVVVVDTYLSFMVDSASEVPGANKVAEKLAAELNNPAQADNIWEPQLGADTTTFGAIVDQQANPVPVPAPSPPPAKASPPPPPPKKKPPPPSKQKPPPPKKKTPPPLKDCIIKGTYQLVAGGRSACGASGANHA